MARDDRKPQEERRVLLAAMARRAPVATAAGDTAAMDLDVGTAAVAAAVSGHRVRRRSNSDS